MSEYSIYCIQNVRSGLIYFGQTRMSPNKRRNEHFTTLRKGVHRNWRLQCSYNHHGLDAFEFSILETHPTHDGANNAERFFIGYFRFLGARLCNADNGGTPMTDETIEKIRSTCRFHGHPVKATEAARIANTGRKVPLETRTLMSVSRKGKPAKRSQEHTAKLLAVHINREHTEEEREKRRVKMVGRRHSAETKQEISIHRRLNNERIIEAKTLRRTFKILSWLMGEQTDPLWKTRHRIQPMS